MKPYRDGRRPHGWLWDDLYGRLWWLYGATSAARVLDGKDPDHEADVAAWRRLGNDNHTDQGEKTDADNDGLQGNPSPHLRAD